MNRFILVSLLLVNSVIFSQITVDNTQTAQDLVNLLFNNSGCATVSNFSVSGNNSYGSFNKNGSDFSFNEGIVLSTGNLNNVPGPNNNLSDDNLGTGTDVDLASIFSDTYDTTVLEFDFVPQTSYISFDYIFASEEYQEGNSNTCEYSDVFAFLIKSNTETNYTNIAVVPGTDTPVQVTTVHPDVTSSCQAENEIYFGNWNPPNSIPINFNGQTATLKAKSNVIPGETYHIKLIIADHQNYQYDSAVFLKAGSFNVGTNLGVDFLRDTKNPICGGDSLILDCNYNTAVSYNWFVDNIPYNDVFVPISGENSKTYKVITEGRYKVEVDLGGGCISEGEITVEFDDLPTVFDTEIIGCNDDFSDFYEFDLTEANSNITDNDSDLSVTSYYHSFINADTQNNPISNINKYTNQSLDEEIYARVENQNGCASIAKIILKVYHNPKLLGDKETFYCLNDYPNPLTLDSGLLYGDIADFTYKWVYNNGIDAPLDLSQNSPTIDIINSGVYTVEVTSSDGCMVSRDITVTNSNIATIIDIVVAEEIYPNRVSIKIEVIGEGDYQYAIDDYNFQDSPIFEKLLYGYHIVTVKDKNGCLPNTQKDFTILNYKKFFTPNEDGKNDKWNLNNDNSLLLHYNTISNLTIYDRFGKIMAVIDPKGEGWNGNYKGSIAFPEDYWFSVKLIDFKGKTTTKRGNFSLVR